MGNDYATFYEKQISLTEWFEAIGHPQAAKLRLEDNDKRERLKILHDIIDLPFDKPSQFSAQDVAKRTPEFKKFLQEHGNELCAVRVIPDDPTLPKLRMRGKTIVEGTDWLDKQNIDTMRYRVDFVPHSDKTIWATIFVVSKEGIFGELTTGAHHELTQGLYTEHQPITFKYDYKTWHISRDLPGVKNHLQDIIARLHVSSPAKQKHIQNSLNGAFAHDYLVGYFETSTSKDRGVWFIDYNRLLGDLPAGNAPEENVGAIVSGRCSCPGKITGTVRIVQPDEIETTTIKAGEILVCPMTTPDYLPLMQQSAAIVTELGGVLSHAAIIARELKKPCITGATNATKLLKPGQKITVDATAGVVTAA